MRDFGDDVFAGTAKYYVQFRAAYPQQIFADIVQKFGLDGSGWLLDLGCGTGELAIPLAKHFEKVLAIDPDNQMLEEGHKKAHKLGVYNIDWQKGSSKTLTEVKKQFKLVVMGQSFHWMDGGTVLREVYDSLEGNGGLIIIGSSPTAQNRLATDKDRAVQELVTRYLGPKRRAGKYVYEPTGETWERDLFPSSGFKNFEKRNYVVRVERNIDQVIGNLFSMSFASKKLLGDLAPDFEKELRQKLYTISADGNFVDHVQFSAYFLIK